MILLSPGFLKAHHQKRPFLPPRAPRLGPEAFGQSGLCLENSGCDLSFRTTAYIVVAVRAWCRRGMIFLREELIAEGSPQLAERISANLARKRSML